MTVGDRAEWRFLGITTSSGATNMAIDEAILIANSQNLVPNTVRLYRWNPPAVSIGYFLKVSEVVDTEACTRLGIDVVRRISGGGAVYHSTGEVTYSVVARQNDSVVPKDPIDVYRKLSLAIAAVPEKIGIAARFESGHEGVCPYTTVHGKKIGGNAQVRKKGVILQHGTLLLDCDLEVMASVLKIPYRLIDDKVTTIKKEARESFHQGWERTTDFTWVESTLRRGFQESLGIRLMDGVITKFESEQIEKLTEKYSSTEWTRKH